MQRRLGITLILSLILLGSLSESAHAQKRNRKNRKHRAKTEQLQPHQIDSLLQPIPINRQAFTDKISHQVNIADRKDGSLDKQIAVDDPSVSEAYTQVIILGVPRVMHHIENMQKADHFSKIAYHRALENMVRRFNIKPMSSTQITYLRRSLRNFDELIHALETNTVKEYTRSNANIYTLDNSDLLKDYPEEKAYVFATVGKAKPEVMIRRLPEFAKESYADPIVATAAQVVPGTILTYATSTSYLNAVVRRNKDPLVQTIVRIASESRNPLKALPFLGDIYNKRKTVREVDAITNNPVAYYKALVALKVQNETLATDYIDKELDHRGLQFVRKVNELHNASSSVRFKSLLPFGAEDLYFMMIGSQDEIYTSSFTWMFQRMMEKMKPLPGDQLLDKVHKNHFRTFIRMCAGYNTLTPFLTSIDRHQKELLMKDFVAGLEQGDQDDLADAVDVADAFGSITDPELIAFLKSEVQTHLKRMQNMTNEEAEKGAIVYGLLYTIFESSENTDKLSSDLNGLIPPITYVPNTTMRNSEDKIIIRTYFYGDEDGKISFNSFKSNFPSAKWSSESNKQWIKYTSKGSKNTIIVYANLPLTEPADEAAQEALTRFLNEKGLEPSVVIHRGHSYHLQGSLANLSPATKVVMLGSCGGYHNLAAVLDKAPDANIISSKQIGSFSVNEPIIREMLQPLQEGKDLDWINAWSSLNQYFSKRSAQEKDLFSDYVPPNKNLGAIFIKAYRKQLALLEEEED